MKIQQQYFVIMFVLSNSSIINAEKFRDTLLSLGEYHLIGNGALVLKPKEMTSSKKLTLIFSDMTESLFINKVNQADFDGKMSSEFWKFMRAGSQDK